MAESDAATVLVVDDEESIVDLYETFLSRAFTVRTATSGTEALERVDDDVDVVILDRRMPGMAGDEVLAELTERGIDAQVAIISGVRAASDIVDMPIAVYETKPINMADLVTLVSDLLERSTYDEDSREYLSLASKKAAIESADYEDDEGYRELIDRMEELRDHVDAAILDDGAGPAGEWPCSEE